MRSSRGWKEVASCCIPGALVARMLDITATIGCACVPRPPGRARAISDASQKFVVCFVARSMVYLGRCNSTAETSWRGADGLAAAGLVVQAPGPALLGDAPRD